MKDLATINAQVCQLAREAGEKIMGFYKEGAAVTWKADASPLTAADRVSHEFIVERLKFLLPEIPIISEESEAAPGGRNDGAKVFWLVDPLDGTKEFLKRTNEFTVNLALIDGAQTVLGVVHAPALSLTYFGLRNLGSWRQIGDERPSRISTRRVDLQRLSVVASKDHAGPLVAMMLKRLPTANVESLGSSLKFCLVGEGKADIYLRDLPTMEWDTAAAQCVVEAAGGSVCSLDGRPLRYGKPGLKNPAIMTTGDAQFDWTPLIS